MMVDRRPRASENLGIRIPPINNHRSAITDQQSSISDWRYYNIYFYMFASQPERDEKHEPEHVLHPQVLHLD